MPKSQFPIGSIVSWPSQFTIATGIVVGINPTEQSKMSTDRYHIYRYDLNLFDYPPTVHMSIIQPPNDKTKQEVQNRLLSQLSKPNDHIFSIGDMFIDDCLYHLIIDNGHEIKPDYVQYHVATYAPNTTKYFLNYVSEQDIIKKRHQIQIHRNTPEAKYAAHKIICEHILQPAF